MNRSDRRRKTRLKLMQRERLMAMFGLQGGTVYQRHRDKIAQSSGYMRTGNVSHFVSTKPRKKTRCRDRYGRVFTPPARDVARMTSMDEQIAQEDSDE